MVRTPRLYGCVVAVLVLLASATACNPEGHFPPPTVNMLAPAPSWLGMPYQDVTLTNSKGNVVHGWFIPAEDATATVLVHHGAVGNRSSTVAQYSVLHALGYHVMVYDYQGFGENYNTPNLGSILSDANAALAYLQSLDGPGSDRIIIVGLSLGTLPAIAQAVQSPDRVIGLVLEGSFSSADLPPWSLYFAGIAPWANAIDHLPAELEPTQHIADILVPTLFMQSREDLITPFAGAVQLCEMASEPKQFVEVTGGHLASVVVDPQYVGHLGSFLDRITADD